PRQFTARSRARILSSCPTCRTCCAPRTRRRSTSTSPSSWPSTPPSSSAMAARRVLVLGGYGAFGSRIAERLARDRSIEVVIAGRPLGRALDLAGQLAQSVGAKVQAAAMDTRTVRAFELRAWKPDVLINASGPYQEQDYALARACIGAGIHYVDLADARAFVTGIGALDADARSAGVLVVSGASTVPAVS